MRYLIYLSLCLIGLSSCNVRAGACWHLESDVKESKDIASND